MSAVAVICVIDDAGLRQSVERAAAAAGVRLVPQASPPRRNWAAAAAIIIDEPGARRCAQNALPRRDRVLLVTPCEPAASTWAAAVAVGAHGVCTLPDNEDALLSHLSDAAERGSAAARPGRVIAVMAGRGGAGGSVFATALAQSAVAAGKTATLLVDVDPYGGGLDLLLGAERTAGLRWPDVGFDGGRLKWSSLCAALPLVNGVYLLSSDRRHHDIEATHLAGVIDCGRRSSVTVVCDVPRQLTTAAVCVLEIADLVVVVTTCDVRAIAATSALVGVVRTVNPHLGLVVRGPAPGGLRAAEAADVTGIPLLATMRPEPSLAVHLERNGLVQGRRGRGARSPLATAAAKVLRLLEMEAAVA